MPLALKIKYHMITKKLYNGGILMGLKDIFNISKILKENHRLKNLIATLTAKITEMEEKYQKLQEDYSQLEQTNTFSQINTINNINESSVDELLNRFDKLTENKPSYTELINNIKPYKKSNKREELILILKNKIDSKETFLNLEQNAWNALFIILGLLATIFKEVIIKYYNYLSIPVSSLPNWTQGFLFFIGIEVVLYCLTIPTFIKKKQKETIL